MKRIGTVFILAVGLLAAAQAFDAAPASAQTSTTGAVRGRIIDKGSKDAVVGATVVATGPALQGQQAEITGDDGSFTINNLPPGIYILTVYYNEAQFSRPNVLIELGKQAYVNIPIDTSVQTSEVIQLEGRAPIVDQGSTKVGNTITDEYTRHIPTGRTFGEVLGTAAGTQKDIYGQSFSGSTSAENTYIVEGINTTDTAYGGQVTNLPNEFIQETEVIAGGYNAEYGRSTGGVINVVTKSGSNQFKGSIFAYYTPGSMVAAAEPILREGSAIGIATDLNYSTDLGFEVGGPIIKDKLWFHIGANPSVSQDTVDRITSRNVDKIDANGDMQLDPCETDTNGNGIADPDEQISGDCDPDVNPNTGFLETEQVSDVPISQTAKTWFVTGKINGAITENHQFQIAAFGNPHSIDRDFYRYTATRSAELYKYDNGAYDAALKWTSKFANNKTQLDIVAGFHRAYDNQDPYFTNGDKQKELFFRYTRPLSELQGFESFMWKPGNGCDDGNMEDPYKGIDNCPVDSYVTGGVGYLEDRTNDRLSLNAALTQRVKLAGHHTFKLGIDTEKTTYDSSKGYTGGGIWYQTAAPVFDSAGNVTGFGNWNHRTLLEFAKDPNDPNAIPCVNGTAMCTEADTIAADTSNQNLGAYLQDSWQVRPNLTVNAGLRWEQQSLGVAKFLQGTTSPEGEQVPDTGVTLKNMWAPRIGAIFDPTQEGRAKLFTHWGRFYESVPMDLNIRSLGGEIINFATVRPSPTATRPGQPVCPAAATAVTVEELEACVESTGGYNNPSGSQAGGGISYIASTTKGQFIDEFILGGEYELMADFKMGMNFVHRDLGRVIEDMSTDGGTNYLIANPGEDFSGEAKDLHDKAMTERAAGNDDLADLYDLRAGELENVKNYDKPYRGYDAVQITANQRFSKNAMLIASYTYSRSKGNFPGLFSTETGQLDPNITSMYDLPNLMANRYGPMGLDRPHNLKVDGFYQFDLKKAGLVVLGASFRAQSGLAHNTLGSATNDYGPDEAYILARGSARRSPLTWNADIRATYGYRVNKTNTLEGFVDVFNLFNNQNETDADERYTTDIINPVVNGDMNDLTHAKTIADDGTEQNKTPSLWKNYGHMNGRQAPLSVRFGLRYTF